MSAQIMSNIGEWYELESDPGLFTILCEEFNVRGVEVEEIYDLEKPFDFDAFGFIFLFKWTDERKARRSLRYGNDSMDKSSTESPNGASSLSDSTQANTSGGSSTLDMNVNSASKISGNVADDGRTSADKEEELFFAHQIVTNSCATHALLSILLNCGSRSNVFLGDLLTGFREFTRKLSPEDRGYAIGSTPKLVEIHNSHARHERRNTQSTSASKPSPTLPNGTACVQKQDDTAAFHYVSFVPVNGRLMELDGLRELPEDHGPVPNDGSFWTEHFRNLIRKRVGLELENSEGDSGVPVNVSNGTEVHPGDIRYSLMAVVPDKRVILKDKMNILKKNFDTIQKTVEDLVNRCGREKVVDDMKMEVDEFTTPPTPPDEHNDEAEDRLMLLNEQLEKIKDSQLKVSVTQVVETGNGDRPLMQPCTTVASTDITKPLHIAVTDVVANTNEAVNASIRSAGATALSVLQLQLTSPYATSPSSTSGAQTREMTTPTTNTTVSPTPSPSSVASAATPRSKYSTRSSTRLNTIASNSLANARNDGNSLLSDRISSHKGFSPEELLELAQAVVDAIKECDGQLRDQEGKRVKYLEDDQRRRHDYSEFIHTFVHMLVESGRWAEVEQAQREKQNPDQRDSRDITRQSDQRYETNLRVRTKRSSSDQVQLSPKAMIRPKKCIRL